MLGHGDGVMEMDWRYIPLAISSQINNQLGSGLTPSTASPGRKAGESEDLQNPWRVGGILQ